MNILYTVAAVVQIIALWYLLQVAFENSRSFTLSKNSKWVSKNSDFLEKYRKPSGAFILIVLGALLSAVIFYLQTDALDMAWSVKNGGIIMSLFPLIIYALFKEKKIGSAIPDKTVRGASLQQRTFGDYIPKPVQILAISITVLTIALPIISFGMEKISISAMVFDLLFALFGYGVCYGTIINTIRKKEPHPSELKPFTTEDITENYRSFSVRLMIGAVFVFSLLSIAFVVAQWSGQTLIVTPAVSKVYGWFGETVPDALVSKYRWDAIISLLSSVLFMGMALSKPLQNYRSTKLYA